MDAKWNRIADNGAVRIELWNSCRVAGDQLRLVRQRKGLIQSPNQTFTARRSLVRLEPEP